MYLSPKNMFIEKQFKHVLTTKMTDTKESGFSVFTQPVVSVISSERMKCPTCCALVNKLPLIVNYSLVIK